MKKCTKMCKNQKCKKSYNVLDVFNVSFGDIGVVGIPVEYDRWRVD